LLIVTPRSVWNFDPSIKAKKQMKKIIHLSILLTLATTLTGQNSVSKNYLALELDPAPFILGGYSFSFKYSAAALPHFALTGSIYGSPMPDNMISRANRLSGFHHLTINCSYALFADYFIRDDRSGFYFGPSVFFYSKSVSIGESRQHFKSTYPNLRAGYVYRPFKKCGFYLNPWLNVGRELQSTDSHNPGEAAFSLPAISYILALHIGYQVTF
jgi:hypothetical protein